MLEWFLSTALHLKKLGMLKMHSIILTGTSCTVENLRYTMLRVIEKVRRGGCVCSHANVSYSSISAPNQMKTKERGGGGGSNRSVCKLYL